MDYAVSLVIIANKLPRHYQFSFSDQLRRAALSIPSNIAEGAGRSTRKDQAGFYTIARGSVYESVNILQLLERLSEIPANTNPTQFYNLAEEICKMLYGLTNRSS